MSKIIKLEETASTNEYLKSLNQNESLEEGTIVCTNFQSEGKGQGGNKWHSEQGKNLTFSILLQPTFLDIRHQFFISEAVSVALCDFLKKEFNLNAHIKWPNDIYIENFKIAGILIENILIGNKISSSIIGIGLNINQEEFPSNIPNPISIQILTGQTYDLDILQKKIQEYILSRYIQLIKEEDEIISREYKHKLFRKEGFHQYKAGENIFSAKIKTVLPTGHLILEDSQGQERAFVFKEISFVI